MSGDFDGSPGPYERRDESEPAVGGEPRRSRSRLSDFLSEESGPRRPSPGSRRYSRFVRSMKYLLPAVAALLVGIVVAWPQFEWDGTRTDPSEWQVQPEEAENLSMTDPRYVGVDEQERPFVLTADGARQVSPDTEQVALTNPKGDITLSDGAWVAVTAREGIFDRDTYKLELFGGVEVFHDEGYTLTSESVHVDLRAGTATGDRPVTGHGPGGSLAGEGFKVLDRGDTIVLSGRSSMLIRPNALRR